METSHGFLIAIMIMVIAACLPGLCIMLPTFGEWMCKRLGYKKVSDGMVAITAVLLAVGAYGNFAGWWAR